MTLGHELKESRVLALVAFARFGRKKFLELVLVVDKVIGVWKRVLFRRDIRPFFRVIAINL